MINTIPNCKGKIYPDRSFSVGYSPFRKPGSSEKHYDSEQKKQFWNHKRIVQERGKFVLLCEGLNSQPEDPSFCFNGCQELSQKISPFLESEAEREPQKKKKYGLNGLTPLGKRMCKNGALLLQQKYGRKRLGFITMTLPNFSKKNLEIISTHWSQVQRRFFQSVKRRLQNLGQPEEIISCTEIQPKRYKNRGEIAPHLHFVYVSRKEGRKIVWNIVTKIFRIYWKRAITQVLEKHKAKVQVEINWLGCCDAKSIRKCVAKYISKYISKGGEIIADIIDDGREECLPSQWWSASKLMKKMFYDSIIHMRGNDANFLFKFLNELKESGELIRGEYIEVEINGEYKTMGCSGVFSDDFYEKFCNN